MPGCVLSSPHVSLTVLRPHGARGTWWSIRKSFKEGAAAAAPRALALASSWPGFWVGPWCPAGTRFCSSTPEPSGAVSLRRHSLIPPLWSPCRAFLTVPRAKIMHSMGSEGRLSRRNDSFWGREGRPESPLPSCLNPVLAWELHRAGQQQCPIPASSRQGWVKD